MTSVVDAATPVARSRIWLDRRAAGRLIRLSALLLAGLLLGFGAYYYQDRYAGVRTPVVDQALRTLEDAVRKDPSNVTLRLETAGAYLAAEKPEAAIQQFREVLKAEPENQAALTGLGHAHTARGEASLAAEPYQKVVDLNRDNEGRRFNRALATVYYHLGAYRLAQGQMDEAIALLHESLAIEPADADARYLLGKAQQRKGALDAAIASYQDAVRFVPDFAEAYEGLASAYLARGETLLAAYARGMLSLARKDYGAAMKQLESVARAQPDFWEAHYGLGMAAERAGRRDEAIRAYRTALGIKPDYLWARGALQRLGAN